MTKLISIIHNAFYTFLKIRNNRMMQKKLTNFNRKRYTNGSSTYEKIFISPRKHFLPLRLVNIKKKNCYCIVLAEGSERGIAICVLLVECKLE